MAVRMHRGPRVRGCEAPARTHRAALRVAADRRRTVRAATAENIRLRPAIGHSGFGPPLGLSFPDRRGHPSPAAPDDTMRPRPLLRWLGLLAGILSGVAAAQGFKFGQADDAERFEQENRRARIAEQLSTPCREDLRNRKIMVVIGEVQSNGYVAAQQQNYGPHFEAINARLRALGLRTYTPEEIRRQIAQAEIDAYFRNDPDAALSASKRLGASFVLRGLIHAEATRNPMMAVNQVSVAMSFTLYGADGRLVSATEASSASYAGADVNRMALTLVNEKADEVVATLYSDYCRQAGPPAARKPAAK